MRLPYACLLVVCWYFDSVESSVIARGINRDDQKGTGPNLEHSNVGESQPRGLSNQATGTAVIDWYDDDAVPNDDFVLPIGTHTSGFVHLGRAGKLQMTGMAGGMNAGTKKMGQTSKCTSSVFV